MKTTYPLTEFPNVVTLKEELHELLSVFVASQLIAERSLQREPLLVDFADVREQEDRIVARLLLSCAISLRVLDDRTEHALDACAIGVGRFFKSIPALPSTAVELSLREACNKLIHADYVELERTVLAECCEYLAPNVGIYGKSRNDRGWYVELDATTFAQEAILAINELYATGKLPSSRLQPPGARDGV